MARFEDIYKKIFNHHHEQIHQNIAITFSELIEEPWKRTKQKLWKPAIDVYETETQYLILADLPGVSSEEIEIFVRDSHIVIYGKRQAAETGSIGKPITLERAKGAFSREIKLAHNTDMKKIEAHGKNGVMEITIPKCK